MAEIFNNMVSSEQIEKFFLNMVVSDVNMPHTSTKLSPITFSEFLSRNGIVVHNQFAVYKEANKIWRKFFNDNTELFKVSPRHQYDMDQAETPHPAWHPLVDYLKRILELENIDAPYFQMHYLSHVCNNFYRETERDIYSSDEKNGFRTIFNQVINPILYEPIIPVNYVWLPIENYADIRFQNDVQLTIARAKNFITNHTGAFSNYPELDKVRTKQYKEEIEKCITDVYSHKYSDPEVWGKIVIAFLSRCAIYKTEMRLHEMYDTFEVGGFRSIKIMKGIDRISDRFHRGYYGDSIEDLVDDLLGVRPTNEEMEKLGVISDPPKQEEGYEFKHKDNDEGESDAPKFVKA